MANVVFKRGGLEGCGLFPGLLSENRYICARKLAKVRASLVAQTVKNLRAIQETQAQSLGREDPSGGGNGYLLQYSCLENPMDAGAWWVMVSRAAKGQTQLKRFSRHALLALPPEPPLPTPSM